MSTHFAAYPKLKITLLLASAALLILAASAAVAPSANAGGGGVSLETAEDDQSGDEKSGSKNATPRKYRRLWKRASNKDKRWARRTSECESGGDPDAIGGGGKYRGAFQFLKSTWRGAPKSPGGDPIRFSYKTQAVVAVALKRSDGPGHWPVCG